MVLLPAPADRSHIPFLHICCRLSGAPADPGISGISGISGILGIHDISGSPLLPAQPQFPVLPAQAPSQDPSQAPVRLRLFPPSSSRMDTRNKSSSTSSFMVPPWTSTKLRQWQAPVLNPLCCVMYPRGQTVLSAPQEIPPVPWLKCCAWLSVHGRHLP